MTFRLILLFSLFQTIAQAQQPRFFQHFTEKDGLSDPNVQAILRDRQGYLWVGTAAGLNRYDGYTFHHFLPDTKKNSLTVSNENINDIKQDSAGFIWIATRKGLNRFDPRTNTFKVWENTGRNDGSLPNSLVTSILIDKKNRLWLCCDNRDLTLFDTRTEVFKTFPWKAFAGKALPEKAANTYKTIYFLSQKSPHEWWLHTNLGIFSFDAQTEQFTFHTVGTNLPKAIKTDCDNRAYFGSWDADVLCYDACHGQWTQIDLPLPTSLRGGSRQVCTVVAVGNANWVLARQGLFLMDTQERILPLAPTVANQFTAPTGLISTVFKEPNGVVWLGGEKGLWRFDPTLQHVAYEAITPDNTGDFYNTYCRFLDASADKKRYVLDFYGNKALVLESGKITRNIPLPGRAALLHETQDGAIWIGGGNKIFRLDPHNERLTPLPIPENLLSPAVPSIFQDMAEDAAGNLWFANNKQGIYVYNPTQRTWWKPSEKEDFIAEGITCVFADPAHKTVWIGSEDYGLFRYDEATRAFTLYRHEERDPEHSLGAYIVNSVCRDGQGYIWVATDPGGISRFDYAAPTGKEFITLNTEHGLPSNQVVSLIADQKGNIWAGTTKGLSWVDTRTMRVRSFAKASGLEQDYLDLPLNMGARGEIIAGSKFGYQWFFPDSLLMEKPDGRVLLTGFKIFDKDYANPLNINFLSTINLTWKENFFTFEFAAAEFAKPAKNEYAYRLAGFDADWIFCKNRHQAAYTNVPPGQYLLEIKSGQEGRWNEPSVRLAIHIAPPFWQTWWFRLLALLSIVGIASAAYRYHIAQIRREEALKTAFNQRVAKVEMTALRAQMNPHFVFNCLNSINRFILVNEPDAASNYLTKFSKLIRLILDNSRSETVPLDKELEALRLYIEMEAMRFQHKFEFSVDIQDGLPVEHLEIPPLLIQPFVENAIWHGLMHKKEAGKLTVRVFQETKTLCIEVEDNGIGREQAKALKSKSALEQKSHGMQVTAERLDMIHALYGTRTSIKVDDLKHPDGSAAGTRVTVRLMVE